MQGNLLATALIAMVASTVVIVKIAGRRPSFLSTLGGAVFAPALFACMVYVTPVCACRRGGSGTAEVLAALLAGVVFAVVPRRAIKLSSITVLVIVGFALTMWAMALVHQPGYIGNRNWPRELDRMYGEDKLKTAALAIRIVAVEHPTAMLPEGWVEESLETVAGEDIIGERIGYTGGVVTSYWHTLFTGIYHLDDRWKGVWCAGGPIAESPEKLEAREREEPTNRTEDAR